MISWTFRARVLLLILALGAAGRLPAQENAGGDLNKPAAVQRVVAGLDLLDRMYWSPALSIWLDRPADDLRAHFDGKRNPPWWGSANAVELLVDAMGLPGVAARDDQLESLYTLWKDPPARLAREVAELRRRGQWTAADDAALLRRRPARAPAAKPDVAAYYTDFQNEYLDDSGWWALAWLKMYDRKREEKYLRTAVTIHAHMARNWRPEKGGGILWCEDEDKQRPNSITNGLFLVLSARLYERTKEPAYLEWAGKSLDWIHQTGLYDGTGVVDGPGHQGDYWSYNQGAFVGGLTALYLATERQRNTWMKRPRSRRAS